MTEIQIFKDFKRCREWIRLNMSQTDHMAAAGYLMATRGLQVTVSLKSQPDVAAEPGTLMGIDQTQHPGQGQSSLAR